MISIFNFRFIWQIWRLWRSASTCQNCGSSKPLFKATVQNYSSKVFLLPKSTKLLPKAAPQSCSPKRFSAAASQSCSPKYSCKEICSPKWLRKTSFQSGSRKLFRKITIENCPPKLHSKAAVFQSFCSKLPRKAVPQGYSYFPNCFPKLLNKAVPQNYYRE